jgi:hypothetical protein
LIIGLTPPVMCSATPRMTRIPIYALLLVNVGNYVSGAAAISTVLNLDLTTAAVIQ